MSPEKPQTPEQQIRRRLLEVIKKTRPEQFSEQHAQTANNISAVLNQLKDAKLPDLSAWPKNFSFAPTDKLTLIGKMGEKSIKASRSIELGSNPEEFLTNLEQFLKSGVLPSLAQSDTRAEEAHESSNGRGSAGDDAFSRYTEDIIRETARANTGRTSGTQVNPLKMLCEKVLRGIFVHVLSRDAVQSQNDLLMTRFLKMCKHGRPPGNQVHMVGTQVNIFQIDQKTYSQSLKHSAYKKCIKNTHKVIGYPLHGIFSNMCRVCRLKPNKNDYHNCSVQNSYT